MIVRSYWNSIQKVIILNQKLVLRLSVSCAMCLLTFKAMGVCQGGLIKDPTASLEIQDLEGLF